MYQVIEFAGMYNENEVEIFSSLIEARDYIKEMYDESEVREMLVDITFNGSTEY